MSIRPVSFGSLMVFTTNDKPKAPMPLLMKAAFNNPNRDARLKEYNLTDMVQFSEKIDGTVDKAASKFARKLDNFYRKALPKGSKDVKLTEVEFYINPRETRKKYFLTAATEKDEALLHSILSKSDVFYTNKFGNKK